MNNENKLSRKPHQDRPDLTGEHKLGDLGQVILFFAFMIIWIVDSFLFHWSDFAAERVPLYVAFPLGIVILTAAVYFARSGLKIVFKDIRDKPEIIRIGVFNRVRHPIYLGAILFYLGLLIIHFSLLSFFIWIFILAFYNYIAAYEEKLLVEKFGDDYDQYMAEVPRWLPRIKL